MCLLIFSYKMIPDVNLAVAANRDEFYARPTLPLGYLDNNRTVIGGRDLEAGGTWMGATTTGKFAALTNYRQGGAGKSGLSSRGEIVLDFLSSDISAEKFSTELFDKARKYDGFNFICCDGRQLVYFSNRGPEPQILGPGLYGVSNSLLDVPWPKVKRAKQSLAPHLTGDVSIDIAQAGRDEIINMLQDQHVPADEDLPDTGVGLSWERTLGSIFIDSPGYGTRSSAIVFMTDKNAVFHEATYVREGETRQINWKSMSLQLAA